MLQITDALYYMAVFTSNLSQVDNEYHLLDDFLMKKIENIDGYFGIESVRNDNGKGISTIYFKTLESLDL